MGHIKVSQIRIHLIENIEKYIGTCITKLFLHVFSKPNPSPIINRPHNRHDEFHLLSSSRPATLLIVLLQRFPYVHSFSNVAQILTLIGEVSPHLIKEPITIIPTSTANYFVIAFFFFIHHEVLIVVKRKVHVVFKHDAS